MQISGAVDPATAASQAADIVQVCIGLVSIALALVAIVVAYITVRDQRLNRDFPSDKAYAEEFAARLAEMEDALQKGTVTPAGASLLFNQAVANYGSRSRHDRDELRGHLSYLEQQASRLLMVAPAGPVNFQMTSRVNQIVRRATAMATDWAYPERRRAVLTDAYRAWYPELDHPEHTLDLTVQRWLLSGLPSQSHLVQMSRRARIWVLEVIEDVQLGRSRDRWRAWRQGRRIARSEGRGRRVDRAQRRSEELAALRAAQSADPGRTG